jgi:hypothetical protein
MMKNRTILTFILGLVCLVGVVAGYSASYYTLKADFAEVKENYIRQDVLLPQIIQIQKDVAEIKADLKAHMKQSHRE